MAFTGVTNAHGPVKQFAPTKWVFSGYSNSLGSFNFHWDFAVAGGVSSYTIEKQFECLSIGDYLLETYFFQFLLKADKHHANGSFYYAGANVIIKYGAA